ncbi:MAG TPA: hypothetical protein VNU48_09985 [Burkholderiaceae bacterium]|nr:hypothetical protein [Burkholderiaceae bacterium]
MASGFGALKGFAGALLAFFGSAVLLPETGAAFAAGALFFAVMQILG